MTGEAEQVAVLLYIGLFAILALNGFVVILAAAHAINRPRSSDVRRH
jgi:hypothetical protein